MTSINFNGVESASTGSTFKSVKSGLHNLTITGVEEVTANTGSSGLQVTFESAEAEASFNHTFWLSAAALPRVVYLVEKFTGAKPEGQMSIDSLAASLIGKSKLCVVDGRITTKEKNGKVYNNEYPELRYAGFVDPQGADATPRIKDETVAKPTAKDEETTSAAQVDDDLPF